MFILRKSNGLLTMKSANLGIYLSESDINWSLVLFMAPRLLEHIKIVSSCLYACCLKTKETRTIFVYSFSYEITSTCFLELDTRWLMLTMPCCSFVDNITIFMSLYVFIIISKNGKIGLILS
jgi:hypothetical protein